MLNNDFQVPTWPWEIFLCNPNKSDQVGRRCSILDNTRIIVV